MYFLSFVSFLRKSSQSLAVITADTQWADIDSNDWEGCRDSAYHHSLE